MKYKITLNGKTYEVEVEEGQAMLVDEYEAYKPAAPAAAPAPAPAPLPLRPLPRLPLPLRPLPQLSPQAKLSPLRCPATS